MQPAHRLFAGIRNGNESVSACSLLSSDLWYLTWFCQAGHGEGWARARHDEISSLWSESYAANRAIGAGQHPRLRAWGVRCHVPQSHGAISSNRGQQAAVRGPDTGLDHSAVAFQNLPEFACACGPDTDAPVFSPGGECMPIRTEGDAGGLSAVCGQDRSQLAGRHQPATDALAAARGQLPAIRTETDGSAARSRASECADEPPRLCVPEFDGPILAQRGQEPSVRTKGETPDWALGGRPSTQPAARHSPEPNRQSRDRRRGQRPAVRAEDKAADGRLVAG